MNESDLIPYHACESLGTGSVLVLAPHPDDEVFGCAGALMRHVAAGDAVHVTVVTDGAWTEGADYAELRRRESQVAAAVLGYGNPEFWNLPDRSLIYGEWLIERLAASIEEHGAALIFAPSTREVHPDHRALGLAAAEAVRRCPRLVDLVMYEVGVPLQPNRLLDITSLMERKAAAMACFSSQLERQCYDAHVTALNRFRTYTLPPNVLFAEGYRVVSRNELRADPVLALRQETLTAPDCSSESSLGLPLITVVVRSMERPQLQLALDAAALQTYPHIEILVVSAAVRDQDELPERWGRFPLRQVALRKPESPGHARGTYLAFIDEDTRLEPDHITSLVTLMNVSGGIRCAYAGSWNPEWRNRTAGQARLVDPESLRQVSVPSEGVPLHRFLFHRSLWTEGSGLIEEFPSRIGKDLLLQIARLTPIIVSGRSTSRSAAPVDADNIRRTETSDSLAASNPDHCPRPNCSLPP